MDSDKNYQNSVIFTYQVYNMTEITVSYKRPILTQQAMREEKLNIHYGFSVFHFVLL